MPLNYPPVWEFNEFGDAFPQAAINKFYQLARQIAERTPPQQEIYEAFERGFGANH